MKSYLQSLNHEVTEVRILRKDARFRGQYVGTIISGYYDNQHYDHLIKDIEPYDNDPQTKCIWTTLQECEPALLARGNNRLRTGGKLVTTEDSNIKNFTVFPIDIDCDNPTDTSASVEELKEKAPIASEVYRVITEDFQIPAVKAYSGNGFHILIYINPLKATPENVKRFKATGDIIKEVYGTDPTNYNPARCWKLYGTWVRKGDNIEERPHRLSSIELPDEIIRTDFIELETNIMTLAPEGYFDGKKKKQSERLAPKPLTGKFLPDLNSREDLEKLARDCGVNVDKEWKPKGDYEVMRTNCPLCKREDCGVLTYGSGGECGFKCHTNTCSGKNFEDLYRAAGFSKKADAYEYRKPNQESNIPPTEFDEQEPEYSIIENTQLRTVPVFPEKLAELLPFSAYIKAFEGKTEVCPAFHFATLLTTIGSIIGRTAYFNGILPLYPNLFTCICGQTGASRKSTALALGGRTLTASDRNVHQFDSFGTPEGLIRMFSLPTDQEHGEALNDKYNPNVAVGIDRYLGGNQERLESMLEASSHFEGFRGIAFVDEIAYLFKKANKAGSDGLLQKIGEFYDNKPSVTNKAVSESPTEAINPSLSITGATTISWLENSMRTDDITGGIGRRFLYFVDQGEVTDIALTKPGDETLLKNVANVIGNIRNEKHAAYEYNDEAEKEYTNWYGTQRQRQRDEDDQIMKATGEGIHTHVQKASIIFCVLNQSQAEKEAGTNLIKAEDVGYAILLAEYLRECQQYLFTTLAQSEQEKLDRQIIEQLTEKAWQESRQLYRKLKVSSELMKRALDNLISLEVIVAKKEGRKRLYAVIDEVKSNG